MSNNPLTKDEKLERVLDLAIEILEGQIQDKKNNTDWEAASYNE